MALARLYFVKELNMYLTSDDYADDDFTISLCMEINHGWKMWLASASRDGCKLVPVELSWQKADEIAMDHWNKYQYSLEVYSQGQMASSTSIEMARVAWCKNKAHQIMQEYKLMLGAVCET